MSMPNRSNNERGRSAERMPIGTAMSRNSTAPPTTSESVTGRAPASMSRTSRRVAYDSPSEPWRTISHRNCRYSPSGEPAWMPYASRRFTSWAVMPRPNCCVSGGTMKKSTKANSVIASTSTRAQSSRRITYAVTGALPLLARPG